VSLNEATIAISQNQTAIWPSHALGSHRACVDPLRAIWTEISRGVFDFAVDAFGVVG
jgi:hypothetical protein